MSLLVSKWVLVVVNSHQSGHVTQGSLPLVKTLKRTAFFFPLSLCLLDFGATRTHKETPSITLSNIFTPAPLSDHPKTVIPCIITFSYTRYSSSPSLPKSKEQHQLMISTRSSIAMQYMFQLLPIRHSPRELTSMSYSRKRIENASNSNNKTKESSHSL